MAKVSEGTVYQLEKDKPKGKCRKWRLIVPTGYDPVKKKYRQRTKTFYGTYSAACKALREFLGEVRSNGSARRSNLTYEDCCAAFVEYRAKSGQFAPKTVNENRKRLHQIDHLVGDLRIQELDRSTLEWCFSELRAGNTLRGRPLSGTTMNGIYKSVSLMMDRAVEEGVIASNPCKGMTAPKLDTEPRTPLPPELVSDLLNRLDPREPSELAVILCVTVGLRRGEVCGLSWGDVDLTKSMLHVRRAVDEFGNVKEPKTASSRRSLPLLPIAREALEKRHAAMLQEFSDAPGYVVRSASGVRKLAPNVPVVTNEYGKRRRPMLLTQWWDRNRAKKLGVPEECRLHDLRHTFLSILAEEGVHPRIMQEYAGHARPDITLRIYTHVRDDQKRAAMEQASEAFSDIDLGSKDKLADTLKGAPRIPSEPGDEAGGPATSLSEAFAAAPGRRPLQSMAS